MSFKQIIEIDNGFQPPAVWITKENFTIKNDNTRLNSNNRKIIEKGKTKWLIIQPVVFYLKEIWMVFSLSGALVFNELHFSVSC